MRLDGLLARRPMLAFDIDGTLAPLVAQHRAARLSDHTRELLAAIAQRAVVAIVTGRAVDDARRMLGFEPAYLVGNHGAEGLPGSTQQRDALAAIVLGWRNAIAAGGELPSGVEVEDKTLSLSLHYRGAPDPGRAAADIEDRVRGLEPRPRIVPGKAVVNLVGSDAPDKGDAVEALLEASGCDGALYVGDDRTDETVFARAIRGVLSVRVGFDPVSAATLYLRDQHEVDRLLEYVDGQLRVTGMAPRRA